MKKAAIIIMALLALSLGMKAKSHMENPHTPETDVTETPTKKKLTGIWQMCRPNQEGKMEFLPQFKILCADGTFQNMLLVSRNFRFGMGATGKWKVKGNKLIEIIDSDSGNDFAGKTNAMPLTLSAHGNVMHIVWTRPATGEPVGEYYMRVPTRNQYLEGN